MNDISRLRAVFERRKSTYSGAEVALASTRIEGNLEFIRGTVKFLRSRPANRDTLVDFPRLVLERKFLLTEDTVEPLFAALDLMVRSSRSPSDRGPQLRFSGLQTVVSAASVASPPWLYHLPANLPNAIGEPRFFGWPSEQFVVYPFNANQYLDPPGPIGNARLGVFPNPTTFIDEFIESEHSRWPGAGRALLIVLPDFRARFVNAKVGSQSVCADVECGTYPKERLQFRATADDREVYEAPSVGFDSGGARGSVRVAITDARQSVQLFLMDRESDDMIDWVNLATSSSYLAPEVTYETAGGQIANLIAQGESQTLEFKEIAETKTIIPVIVALANTQGGTILVGVTDSGSAKKVDQAAARQSIEQALRQHCDPIVTLDFEDVEVNGVPILLVRVPRGENPPYRHRGTGVYYIRRGASNFAATPDEIRSLVNRGTSN